MTGQGDTDRPAIDPRHDAIYQRGYQPGDSAPAPRQPLIVPPPAGTSAAARHPADESIDDLADLTLADTDFQDEYEPSRWNPYIALLWLLGVLLPTGGLALQWQAVSGMFQNNSWSGTGAPPFSMVIQQFSYVASPSLITAGFLIMAGLLFWHAVAWRAKRSARSLV
ncbi:MAG: hypothetical protein ABWY68_11195 [Cryobacterium sp.]